MMEALTESVQSPLNATAAPRPYLHSQRFPPIFHIATGPVSCKFFGALDPAASEIGALFPSFGLSLDEGSSHFFCHSKDRNFFLVVDSKYLYALRSTRQCKEDSGKKHSSILVT